jgi:glycosyltransferase involved in cell wall biosynthesis
MTCIYYHPEAYSTSGENLMGRHAAGESFLKGYLKYSSEGMFQAYVDQATDVSTLKDKIKIHGKSEQVDIVTLDNLVKLKTANVVYYPSPNLRDFAKKRIIFGSNSWSLCGVTHTTSSEEAMDAITDYLIEPIEEWDALICTSNSVKDNVVKLIESQYEVLQKRIGASKLTLPQLPVIPLGIHCSDFEMSIEEKLNLRKELYVNDRTIVVLYLGRLSFHAKANPFAMYQALEIASKQTNKNILLIECGWHANQAIANAFEEARRLLCPSVQYKFLDGRNEKNRKLSWASADIFCSLSDNIQETFGITPIEAMASGLPVIVSDWDGYKETIRDGIDGFRIPTLMPSQGLGIDIALRYRLNFDSYDMYCGHASSLVSVDIEKTVDCFIKLFNSNELRNQMGNSGKRRAKEFYDWKEIIVKYEELWAYLKEIRLQNSVVKSKIDVNSLTTRDPFRMFSEYPTNQLTKDTIFTLVDENKNVAIEKFRKYEKLSSLNFAKQVILENTEIEDILRSAESGPKTANILVSGIRKEREIIALRSLTWLCKIGLLRWHV